VGRAPTEASLATAEYAGRDAVEAAMASDPALQDGSRWQIYFAGALASLGFSPEEFARAGPEIRAEHFRANLWCVVRPGTAEALAGLRSHGLTVGCVSNSDGSVAELLQRVGLGAHLAFIVDSGVVGVEKPDPGIFRIALDLARVAPTEALYVGDLYPVDVVGARRAGIEPVLLDPLGRYGDRGCRTTPDIATLAGELVSASGPG
jgi:putative hydrolase of the HAD superfamily